MLYDIVKYTPAYISLFWGILLLIQGVKGDKPKCMLSFFMFTCFFLYLSHAIYFSKNTQLYLFFDPIYSFVTLAVYPLIYWYVKLLTKEKECNTKNLWMFLPAGIMSLSCIGHYIIMDGAERQEYISEFLFNKGQIMTTSAVVKAQIYSYILERTLFVILVAYTVTKSNILISRYNKQIANHYSDTENKTIGWLKFIIWGLTFTAFASIALTLIGRCTFLTCIYLLAIPSFTFSALIFSIGYMGYSQDLNIGNLELDEPEKENIEEITSKDKENEEEHIIDEMVDSKGELILSLEKLFDNDKIYRKRELKISELASSMNSNRTYISNLINTEYGCSFNEFVNGYRIKEAKKLILRRPDDSLDQIAEKVGYGSSSTFLRTFKQREGITPSKFKALMEQEVNLN